MNIMKSFLSVLLACFLSFQVASAQAQSKTPVDYVNPYIGNISHLLVPTYPTVHLPNSMLRVYPERENFTGNTINGLPLIVTSHRGSSAFNLSPFQGDLLNAGSTIHYGYDNEIITPYYYAVDLDDEGIYVKYVPSHQSGIYQIAFSQANKASYLIFNTRDGELVTDGKTITGYQKLGNQTQVYIYLETNTPPLKIGTHKGQTIQTTDKTTRGNNAYYIMEFPKGLPR
ncbi:alpha-1,2-mannosidase [Bacteroides reticulotermitis JCM 10512]|uniref:Alpha-1,2-mannosidase n=1 Tax=Bacteroides reticulotermitis JCM 10512 TaxID=1445607 RepID=W4UUH9_9BACE|nr:alpha-1,2-mannosidase [Bacteroides reticulotermitis JCM 10512]